MAIDEWGGIVFCALEKMISHDSKNIEYLVTRTSQEEKKEQVASVTLICPSHREQLNISTSPGLTSICSFQATSLRQILNAFTIMFEHFDSYMKKG